MIQISENALRDGCERAQDLFLLNRLRSAEEAAAGFDAVYRTFGIDDAMREQLRHAVEDIVPLKGVPVIEATTVASILAGVLVGLLIADSTLPVQGLDLPVVPR